MESNIDDILVKFLIGNCSDEEVARVNAWMKESDANARELFRLEELLRAGKLIGQDDGKRTAKAEQKLLRRIRQEEAAKKKSTRKRRWIRAAACVAAALVAGAAGLWVHQYRTAVEMLVAVADEGGVKDLVLPDGTRVWLNDSATLQYPKEFSQDDRTVTLDGEAYFEVTKDSLRPFTVKSDAMQVRVLGTKFNFKCDKGGRTAEASLIDGEIEVKGNNDEGHITLSPGQRAELNRSKGRLTVKQVDAKLDAVWHNDVIPFEKASIYAISKTLERFYNVKIILSEDFISSKTYSGAIKRQESVESVLTSLQNSIPFEYRIEGNAVFLSPAEK